jgi:hypothetical protein
MDELREKIEAFRTLEVVVNPTVKGQQAEDLKAEAVDKQLDGIMALIASYTEKEVEKALEEQGEAFHKTHNHNEKYSVKDIENWLYMFRIGTTLKEGKPEGKPNE